MINAKHDRFVSHIYIQVDGVYDKITLGLSQININLIGRLEPMVERNEQKPSEKEAKWRIKPRHSSYGGVTQSNWLA